MAYSNSKSTGAAIFWRFGSMFRWVEWRDEGCLWSRWPYRRRGDGLQQMRPVLEDNIDGDSPQMLEEAVCRAARNDRGAPGKDPEISGGVECESEQIEGDQDAGEGFLAVSKVVFEIVSVGLQNVKGLVFDLPPSAAAGGQSGDGVGGDREIGDEAVVSTLAFSVEDLDGEPVDQDGIVRGAQRYGVEPAVDVGRALAAFADGLTMLLQFGALQVLGNGLMRSWLAGEDEVAAGILDGGNVRLAGKQIVTEIDRPKAGEGGAVPSQPALGGIAFAILLLRPVLRRDKFRRQGQDLLVARCDHAGTQESVEVFGAAIGTPPRRALFAFDLTRTEMLGSVQRDQHPPIQTMERCQWPRRFDRFHEQPVEYRRRSAVQHQADVVVGGDRRHAEQRLAVRPAVPLCQRLLMRQERRASHEEDRECRQTDVRHGVVAVAPPALAPVGQIGADLAQRPDHVGHGAHPAQESVIQPPHKRKPLHAVELGQ